MIDGVLRDHQLAAIAGIPRPFGKQGQHLELARGQAGGIARVPRRDPRATPRTVCSRSLRAPIAAAGRRGPRGTRSIARAPQAPLRPLTFAESAGASAVFPILASPVTSTRRPRPSTASAQESSSASRNPPRSDKPSGAGRADHVPNDINHGHIVHRRDRPVKPFQDGYPHRPTWVIIPMRVDWSAP
jgi:hypothetical protein